MRVISLNRQETIACFVGIKEHEAELLNTHSIARRLTRRKYLVVLGMKCINCGGEEDIVTVGVRSERILVEVQLCRACAAVVYNRVDEIFLERRGR